MLRGVERMYWGLEDVYRRLGLFCRRDRSYWYLVAQLSLDSEMSVNPLEGVSRGGYIFEDCPIEDVVVLESFTDKEIAEEFAQVGVVRLIIETQRTSIIQEDGEFIGKSTT